MVVKILIAGLLVVVVVALWQWWSSVRGVSFVPSRERGVHLLAGQRARISAALWRKRARSFTDIRPAGGPRPVRFRIAGAGGAGVFIIQEGDPADVQSDAHGVATVVITAVLPGAAGLTASADSGQEDRMYGPETLPVRVYADQAAFDRAWADEDEDDRPSLTTPLSPGEEEE